jgi:hypothetical protein
VTANPVLSSEAAPPPGGGTLAVPGGARVSSGEHALDPVEDQVEPETELVAEVVAGLQVVGRRHVHEMRVFALGHPFHD